MGLSAVVLLTGAAISSAGAATPDPTSTTTDTQDVGEPVAPAPVLAASEAEFTGAKFTWEDTEGEEATGSDGSVDAQAEADLPAVDAAPTAVAAATPVAAAAASPTYRLRCNAQRVNVYDRFEQCVHVRAGQVDYFLKGKRVGQVRVQWTRRLQLNRLKTTWREDDSFRVLTVSGAGVGTTLSQYRTQCGGTCSAKVTFTPRVLVPRGTFTASIAFSDTTTTRNATRATYTLFFNNTLHGLNAITVNSRQFRCDAQIGKTRGCVFPTYRPTITSMAGLTQIAANIRKIQAAGPHHYGNRTLSGGRYPLSWNPALQAANRQAACPDSRPRPTPDPKTGNWECDEYPFASTNQGATKTTQPDWGWAWVPASEQRQQGGRVRAFTQVNRILTGDQFWVAV